MAIVSSIDIGESARIVEVNHDPTTTPTDVAAGSLIFSTATNNVYRKMDAGDTTNVRVLVTDFGRDAQWNASPGLSSIVSSTWQSKCSITLPASSSPFLVKFAFIGYNSVAAGLSKYRIYDVTNAVEYSPAIVSSPSTTNRMPLSLTAIITGNGASKWLQGQWADQLGTRTAYIRDAYLTAWRLT